MSLLGLVRLTVALTLLASSASPADPLAPDGAGDTVAWLRALTTTPRACLAALDRVGLAYRALADQPMGEGCGYADALVFGGGAARLAPPLAMTCPLAVGLGQFEKRVLNPQAERFFGTKVRRILAYGAFSCRNVEHTGSNRRSEHARANAIDIAGFVLADGRRITVMADWHRPTAAGRFLLAVRDGACGIFPVVLSPVWSAGHRDHFHFDVGPARQCR